MACWDEEAQELVHKEHTPTSQTYEADEGNSMVTYRKWKCQCGNHTMDVFVSAKEKPAQ